MRSLISFRRLVNSCRVDRGIQLAARISKGLEMKTNEVEFILEMLSRTHCGSMPISSVYCRYVRSGYKGLDVVVKLLIESEEVEIVGGLHLRLKKFRSESAV